MDFKADNKINIDPCFAKLFMFKPIPTMTQDRIRALPCIESTLDNPY